MKTHNLEQLKRLIDKNAVKPEELANKAIEIINKNTGSKLRLDRCMDCGNCEDVDIIHTYRLCPECRDKYADGMMKTWKD